MMQKILFTALLASALTSPALADQNFNGVTVDCYCTDKSGSRVELGEQICLQVDGKMFMAQCQMSLNVPMWRKLSDGCMSSELRQPALQSFAIHSQV